MRASIRRASGVTIKNVTFKNCRARSAIQLLNVQRFQVVDALFESVMFLDNNIEDDLEHGGAAVYIGAGCSLMVKDSVFRGNQAQFGGALYVSPMGNLVIEDSLFKDNSASYLGGGAIFSAGRMRVVNTKFQNCRSDGAFEDPAASGPLGAPLEPFRWFTFPEPGASGGAIMIRDGSTSRIVKSLFIGNTAAAGGAVSATYSTLSPPTSIDEVHTLACPLCSFLQALLVCAYSHNS